MRIGIDLGGTNIAIGLLDDNLNIIYKKEFQTEKEKGTMELTCKPSYSTFTGLFRPRR